MGWVKDNVIDPITGASAREASERAADIGAEAGREAIEFQRESRDIARGDLQPFRAFGEESIPEIQQRLRAPVAQFTPSDPSQIGKDPLFQALFGEAERAITARQAAGKGLGTGDTLRDLTTASLGIGADIFERGEGRRLREFGVNQELESQRTRDLFNTLIQGQNAAAGQGTAALQTGSNISDLITQIGNVQGAGVIGAANARAQGVENIIGIGKKLAGIFI